MDVQIFAEKAEELLTLRIVYHLPETNQSELVFENVFQQDFKLQKQAIKVLSHHIRPDFRSEHQIHKPVADLALDKLRQMAKKKSNKEIYELFVLTD